MDKQTEERIKADAKAKYPVPVKFSDQVAAMERREGYIAGATAEHDRVQPVIEAAEKVAKLFAHKGDHQTCAICQLARAIEQWKGKEVEPQPELKEPDKNYSLSTEEKKKLLANKIEARMKEAGLQRQEFADLMGTQPSTITRWLSGEHNFQIDTLFEIEKQLNINLFNY